MLTPYRMWSFPEWWQGNGSLPLLTRPNSTLMVLSPRGQKCRCRGDSSWPWWGHHFPSLSLPMVVPFTHQASWQYGRLGLDRPVDYAAYHFLVWQLTRGQMVDSKVHDRSQYAMVLQEVKWLMGERESVFTHICREQNNASHLLTNFGRMKITQWFRSNPGQIISLACVGMNCYALE